MRLDITHKNFLLYLGIVFGVIVVLSMKPIPPFNSTTAAPMIEKSKTLRHIVLFKFKETTSKEQLKAIEASFKNLPGKIPEIVDFEWGTNNSPEGLDKGFTHCFFVSFADEKGREIYLPHPDHKAFVDLASPYVDDVLVVDYWKD